MKNNSMLRPPLSSTIFPRLTTSRRICTTVFYMEIESTRLQNIETTFVCTRLDVFGLKKMVDERGGLNILLFFIFFIRVRCDS